MATDNHFRRSLTACGWRRSLLGGAALLAVATFSLVAAAKLNRTGDAKTSFKAAGPAGLSIEGKTSDMSIADDGTTVTITVPLSNIDTGIGLRNDHTKKAVEADKYPSVTLKVARAALKFPAAGADSSGDAKGQFTLHGQTKDVTFHYAAKNAGGTISVTGSTRINVNDYGVTPPSYLGVTVKPDVDVSTSFSATDN
jgi:polyisoprenoid-binding protein YceI